MSSTPSLLDHPNRFPRATEPESVPGRGMWSLTFEKGREAAVISCPNCAVMQTIAPGRITARGVVDDVVACVACKWFDYVTLDGWEFKHAAT